MKRTALILAFAVASVPGVFAQQPPPANPSSPSTPDQKAEPNQKGDADRSGDSTNKKKKGSNKKDDADPNAPNSTTPAPPPR